MVQSLLIGSVGFLQIIHHEIAMTWKESVLRETHLSQWIARMQTYPNCPKFHHWWDPASQCFGGTPRLWGTALWSAECRRWHSLRRSTIDCVEGLVRRHSEHRRDRPLVRSNSLWMVSVRSSEEEKRKKKKKKKGGSTYRSGAKLVR